MHREIEHIKKKTTQQITEERNKNRRALQLMKVRLPTHNKYAPIYIHSSQC
jgi:F0F1-type ATP synthase membrane subunit b/b'